MNSNDYMIRLEKISSSKEKKKVQLGDAVHRKLMRDFRLYMLVGGMPQAVDSYVETNNPVFVVIQNLIKYCFSMTRQTGLFRKNGIIFLDSANSAGKKGCLIL